MEIAYKKLLENYQPFVEYLEKCYGESDNPLYLGYQGLQGKLLQKPTILLLGYNPGCGYYNECKLNGKLVTSQIPPNRVVPQSQLDFFKDGSRREGKWNDVNSPVKKHNQFIGKCIRILQEYSKMYNNDFDIESDEFAEWMNNNIMYANLYPFATENSGGCDKLISKLKGYKNIRNNWCFRDVYFVSPMQTFLETIRPKVVVCLGKRTFTDFTRCGADFESDKGILTLMDTKYNNVIGMVRGGKNNWNILGVSQKIVEILKSMN